MRRLALILFIFLFATIVHAQEQITSAFGFKFGEKLPEATTVIDRHREKGVNMVRVEPLHAIKYIDRCSVQLTPQTGLVYGVYGNGTFQGEQECIRAQSVLMDALIRKYGEEIDPYELPINMRVRNARMIMHKNGDSVGILCTRESRSTYILQLGYRVKSLARQAEEERIEMLGKNIGDGL